MTITGQRLALAIGRAQAIVPGLRVVPTAHCDGRTWIVDLCCSVVHISATLDPDAFIAALNEAVDTLARDRRRQQRAHLQLVRAGSRDGVQQGSDGASLVPVDGDTVWVEAQPSVLPRAAR